MHILTGLYSTITTSEKNRTIHIKQAGAVAPACRFNLYRAILTDCLLFRSTLVCWLFQFTRREYGATYPVFLLYGIKADFNSRTANTARHEAVYCGGSKSDISIHAPRIRRDTISPAPYSTPSNFNSRTANTARLSTEELAAMLDDFNSRTANTARPEIIDGIINAIVISIHAPRIRRDCKYIQKTTQAIIYIAQITILIPLFRKTK